MILVTQFNNPGIKKGPSREAKSLFYMARSEGFEPSTARFVAEYSIQLSYECVFFKGRHYREEPLGSQRMITF